MMIKISVISSIVTGQTRTTAGRVVTNTAIQATGNRDNGAIEVARVALVMKTVALGKTISKIADILA